MKLFQIYDISKCIAISKNMLIDTIDKQDVVGKSLPPQLIG